MSKHRAELRCTHCGASLYLGETDKLVADNGTTKCKKSKRGHEVARQRVA